MHLTVSGRNLIKYSIISVVISLIATFASLVYRTLGPGVAGASPILMGYPFQYLAYLSVNPFIAQVPSPTYSFYLLRFLVDVGFYLALCGVAIAVTYVAPHRYPAYLMSGTAAITFLTLLVVLPGLPGTGMVDRGLPIPYLTVINSFPCSLSCTFYAVYPEYVAYWIIDWLFWTGVSTLVIVFHYKIVLRR